MAPLGQTLTRRQTIQLLAALGAAAPAALEVAAQEGKRVSAGTLRDAGPLIDAELTDEQIEAVSRVIQKNIDQYEGFRSFEIDDSVEPAMIFLARGGQ